MTLPASGAISFSQINAELIRGATDPISLNDTAVRRLAQDLTPGSTITVPTDFWGKAANFVGTLTTGSPTQGRGISQDGNGNLYVVGHTRNFGPADREHFYVAKFDSNGVLQWQRGLFSNENDLASAVVANAAGDVYVTGFSNALNVSNYNIFVAKYDTNGVLQWKRRYGSRTVFYESTSIALDASGDVYIGGRVVNDFTFQNFALLFKVSSSGTIQWAQQYGNAFGDYIKDIEIANGNLYVSGLTTPVSSGPTSIFIAKLNLSGVFQWAKRLDDGTGIGAFPGDLSVDASENICISGAREFGGSGNIGILAKFNSAGTLLWATGFQRSSVFYDATATTFMSTGDIFLCLIDSNGGSRIFRISGSGAYVWENQINSNYGDGITNINDSLCFFGAYRLPDFTLGANLLVMPKNGTGTNTYGGQIFYQTASPLSTVFSLTATAPALTLNTTSASTSFVDSALTEAVPTLVYTKYNV